MANVFSEGDSAEEIYLKQGVNHLGGAYGKLLMGLGAGPAAFINSQAPAASTLQTSSVPRWLR